MIIVLKDGTVAEQGSHEQLLKVDNGVYSNLWRAQLHDGPDTASSTDGEVIDVAQTQQPK